MADGAEMADGAQMAEAHTERGTTMGIGASIFLIAVGAIIAFALETSVGWLDLDVVGWVLMLAGLFGLFLAFGVFSRRRRVEETSAQRTVVDTPPQRTVMDSPPQHMDAPPQRTVMDTPPQRTVVDQPQQRRVTEYEEIERPL
jgi:hypothetical protein